MSNIETEGKELSPAAKQFFEDIKKQDNPWGLSSQGLESKSAAMAMLSIRNGMYARVPLVCKAESCPYSNTCQLMPYGMAPEGEYCPIELAQIDLRSIGYTSDLDIESASFTDKALLSELIALDVMLERAKALMAAEGTPVIDMAIGIDREGNPIEQQAVSKAWEAYERISKRRNETYQLLQMTRKDKRNKDDDADSISASKLLKEVLSAPIEVEVD